uniref:Uncharacterized protein n=1 Tax=Oryza nivara TaxID=4536 RepID=A0A0E0HPE8_ORYNI
MATRWWRLTWDDGEDGAPAATGFVEEVVGVRCSLGKVEKDRVQNFAETGSRISKNWVYRWAPKKTVLAKNFGPF